MTDEDLRVELCRRLQPWGVARDLAARMGLSAPYISQMKTGEKKVSIAVARWMGFRRVTVWQPIEGGPKAPLSGR